MTLFNLPPLRHKKQSGTGSVLERSVIPTLEQGGYDYSTQVTLSPNFTGKSYRVDLVAMKGNTSFLISCKWQQSSGTAEEKVCFEVLSLKFLVQSRLDRYRRAYLILAGTAWTLRDYFISDDFDRLLPHRDELTILTLEPFMALANKGAL